MTRMGWLSTRRGLLSETLASLVILHATPLMSTVTVHLPLLGVVRGIGVAAVKGDVVTCKLELRETVLGETKVERGAP